MAYEKRSLRPFDTFDRVQRVFAQKVRLQCPPIPDGFQPQMGGQGVALIGVKNGSITAPGGTLVLDREEYIGAAIGLYFGVHEDDWREVAAAAQDDVRAVFGPGANPPVVLLITAYNSRLRQLAQLYEEKWDTWLYSDSWRHLLVKSGTKDRPRPFKMPADGCTITIQFVLSQDLPTAQRITGRPWRKGSWLSKHEVRVAAARGSGLAPRYLTDELRERFGLGSHTSLYVSLIDGSTGLSRVSDLSDAVTVYIDERLLKAAIEQNAKGAHVRPQGEHLVSRWVMDVYRALIHGYTLDETLSDFDLEDEECRRSFLYSMLTHLDDAGLVTKAEALLILRETPQRFVSLYEHVLSIKHADSRLLGLESPG